MRPNRVQLPSVKEVIYNRPSNVWYPEMDFWFFIFLGWSIFLPELSFRDALVLWLTNSCCEVRRCGQTYLQIRQTLWRRRKTLNEVTRELSCCLALPASLFQLSWCWIPAHVALSYLLPTSFSQDRWFNGLECNNSPKVAAMNIAAIVEKELGDCRDFFHS